MRVDRPHGLSGRGPSTSVDIQFEPDALVEVEATAVLG